MNPATRKPAKTDSQQNSRLPKNLIQTLKGSTFEAEPRAGRYRFKPQGWIAGLKLTRQKEQPELTEKLTRLRACLATSVTGTGREEFGYASVREISSKLNLPDYWIINVIESRLLKLKFPQDAVEVSWQTEFKTIRVPRRFGTDRVDLGF